jgi:hypothetical protein
LSLKNLRLALKHLRRFIAGFISITSFTHTKISKFPFADGNLALDNDRQEVLSDLNLATQKIKQNERKQSV